jgi:hypothetical protein
MTAKSCCGSRSKTYGNLSSRPEQSEVEGPAFSVPLPRYLLSPFELTDLQKNALIGKSRATNITRKLRTPTANPILGGYPSRIPRNHADHSKDGVCISRSSFSTLRGKTKNKRMMSMTNQAQRSFFLYPVQSTIKPIISSPRAQNPSCIKKFCSLKPGVSK